MKESKAKMRGWVATVVELGVHYNAAVRLAALKFGVSQNYIREICP